jgi:hypothetical protein
VKERMEEGRDGGGGGTNMGLWERGVEGIGNGNDGAADDSSDDVAVDNGPVRADADGDSLTAEAAVAAGGNI